MKLITKNVAELKLADKNVRLHGDRQIKEYMRSIEMFGQIRPLVIDEDNVVICGNGLLQAFQKMGKKTAECYLVTGLSKNKKKKLMLTDNKIYELGVNNSEAFDEILNELAGDIDIPGYDEELLKVLTANSKEADDMIASYGNFSDDAVQKMNNAKAPNITLRVQNSPTSQPLEQNLNTEGEVLTNKFADGKFSCTCPRCGFKFNL